MYLNELFERQNLSFEVWILALDCTKLLDCSFARRSLFFQNLLKATEGYLGLLESVCELSLFVLKKSLSGGWNAVERLPEKSKLDEFVDHAL